MQAVVLGLMSCVLLSTYAIQTLGLPGLIKFAPEVLSGLVTIYVLFYGARQRFRNVQSKYWIIFGALTLTVVCGLVANSVASGPTIAGLRYYLRAMPFFFLPAVFNFTERQIKQQMSLLLALALIQIPIAIYQRSVVFLAGGSSGDTVAGTLEESGALSMFLISGVLVVAGLLFKGRISRLTCILLCGLLLLPTSINETKISFLFFPVGLFAAIMIGSPSEKRLRFVAWTAISLVAFGAVAIPVYDYTQQNNPFPQKISLDLLTDSKRNYTEVKGAGIGSAHYVGRKDALTIPVEFLSQDPVWLAFGLGVGNASESSIGDGFTGEYGHLFKMVTISDVSLFLLERGFLGVGLFFFFYFMMFRDAVVVARRDAGLRGAIAVGWTGVLVIMTLGTVYKVTQGWASVAYLFWYVSGLIAARRMQLAVSVQTTEWNHLHPAARST